LALKPLGDAFGICRVSVTTMQALTGAGYPGVSSLDIVGNVLPDIPGEAGKLETETLKILGAMTSGGVRPAGFSVGAQANRVPVLDGHLLSVAVETSRPAGTAEAREAFEAFTSRLRGLGLPSAPEKPVRFWSDPGFPQPRLHSNTDGGMAVGVGGLRVCPALGLRFLVLVHNTVRGAAGGAILNAEFLRERGFLSRV
jgi:aspartate-semialdehyde dehydrogenase